MYATEKPDDISLTLKPQHDPSCLSCKNCEIVNAGKENEFWCCETAGWGMPVKCSPPNDDVCNFYSTEERYDNGKFQDVIHDIQEGDY